MNLEHAHHFLQQLKKTGRFKLFLLTQLPLALVAGIRLEDATTAQASTSLKFGYRTKNPFRSIYFAALSMAAEMSTGLLGFMYVRAADRPVSMLMVYHEGSFSKKAVGRITFSCQDGNAIRQTIEKALEENEPQTIDAQTVGYNEQGEEVARFTFRWSFKAKAN